MARLAVVPPPPRPTAIGKVSPTLLECPLRVAFKLDGDFAWLDRGGTASALGRATHRLAERVSAGGFDEIAPEDIDAALSQAWIGEVEAAQSELRDSWGTEPPEPRRWRGYNPARRRTLRRLADEAERRRAPRAGRVSVALEEELKHPSLPLYGRADRVEQVNGEASIVDLKSGWAAMEELRPAHRRQLLLYAYLWHAVHGSWPAQASVERLDGTRHEIAVDPVEAEAVATQALQARERFNAARARDVWALAAPSHETCAYCPYRPTCPPFFDALTSDWPHYRDTVLGIAQEATPTQDAVAVRLRVLATNIRNLEEPEVTVVGLRSRPDDGCIVAVVDAMPTSRPQAVRIAWNSSVVIWGP